MMLDHCSIYSYQHNTPVHHAEDYVVFLAHAAVPTSLVLSDKQ